MYIGLQNSFPSHQNTQIKTQLRISSDVGSTHFLLDFQHSPKCKLNSSVFGSHIQETLAYLVTVRQIINTTKGNSPTVFPVVLLPDKLLIWLRYIMPCVKCAETNVLIISFLWIHSLKYISTGPNRNIRKKVARIYPL